MHRRMLDERIVFSLLEWQRKANVGEYRRTFTRSHAKFTCLHTQARSSSALAATVPPAPGNDAQQTAAAVGGSGSGSGSGAARNLLPNVGLNGDADEYDLGDAGDGEPRASQLGWRARGSSVPKQQHQAQLTLELTPKTVRRLV